MLNTFEPRGSPNPLSMRTVSFGSHKQYTQSFLVARRIPNPKDIPNLNIQSI